jgi:nucleoid-associated protein YgaU
MSIISFIQDAGERLFPHPRTNAASAAKSPIKTQSIPVSKPDLAALNHSAAEAIKKYIASQGLPADKLQVVYDGATSTVTVTGSVPDQETREKIVVCAGNVASVHHVNDQLTVVKDGIVSEYYTVSSGDTLSKIAKRFYGSADRYSAIFEANRPMLSDPDKIYPGQTLRIPRLS